MTLDDIINNAESAKNQQKPPVVNDGSNVKPQPKPVEQQTAASAQPAPAAGGPDSQVAPPAAPAAPAAPADGKTAVAPAAPAAPAKLSYVQLFQQLTPYRPPTQEELEKEKKKQKREAIFAAIGDGIAALSNLFFTTKGAPNSYNPQYSLSDAYRKRYDKLKAEREANNREYMAGYMRAMQADDSNEKAERAWNRQLDRDRVSDERYNNEWNRNEERYNREWERNDARYKDEQERWQKQFDANENQRKQSIALGWANYNLNKTAQQENARLRELGLKISGAKGVRDKRIGFSDGKGNEVGIYENVWKGSMQQVFEAIAADLRPADEKEAKKWDRTMKKLDTPQKKEDFVKQNWSKSRNASSIMMALSRIDPATMVSGLEGDEDNDDDSTPPSMRNQTNDDDNTPPSKRK